MCHEQNYFIIIQMNLLYEYFMFILTVLLWSFFATLQGHEDNFHKPSPGTDFLFQCLLFGMDFFLWYSCFPG